MNPQNDDQHKSYRQSVHGTARLSFVCDGDETKLSQQYYQEPLKVLHPNNVDDPFPLAVMVTTGGGYFGGDQYEIDVSVKEQAGIIITSQAAEKVYKTKGPSCSVDVQLRIEKNAKLEWLPQETILFNQSRFRRKTRIDIDHSGQALVGEMLIAGRVASGEIFTEGLFREAFEVYRNNSLIWADVLQVDDNSIQSLQHAAGWNGNKAVATVLYIADDVEQQLEAARSFQLKQANVFSAASVVNGVLVLRWLAKTSMDLHRAVGVFWAKFRNQSMNRSTSLPRIWNR